MTNQSSPDDVSADDEARVRRFLRLHLINSYASCVSFVLVFGGVALAFITGVEALLYLPLAGFAIGAIILLQAYIIYPFFRCPRCGNRFFMANGCLGFFTRIQVFQRHCVHCGLSVPRTNPQR